MHLSIIRFDETAGTSPDNRWFLGRQDFVAVMFLVLALPSLASAQLPVVPGATGYGVNTRAAYGGPVPPTVYRVTNLNDSGPGSFRAAVTASGPRVVVFEISGTIVLTSLLDVTNPYLTIAGQTAPSPGITINQRRGIRWQTHDVLIQHVRFRRGNYDTNSDRGGFWIRDNAANIVLDHLSISWGCDENLTINAVNTTEPRNIAVLDSIISEALHDAGVNLKGAHSKGMIAMTSYDGTLTLARNLFAHNRDRNPRVGTGWRAMLVNNVLYNVGGSNSTDGPWQAFTGSSDIAVPASSQHNLELVSIGNVAIPGADTATVRMFRMGRLTAGSQIFLESNAGPYITGSTGSGQWASVSYSGANLTTGAALAEADVRINSRPSWYTAFKFPELGSNATAVRDHILATAGARPADRDPVDARIVQSVRYGTGRVIDTQDQVGGMPTLKVNVRPLTLPSNPHSVTASGYTNLELWLHTYAAAVEGRSGAVGPELTKAPAAPSNVRVVD